MLGSGIEQGIDGLGYGALWHTDPARQLQDVTSPDVFSRLVCDAQRQSVVAVGAVRSSLWTAKAYLLKEDLQQQWDEPSPEKADSLIKNWTFQAMRSRIEPVEKIARMLRRHKPLILDWFTARGVVSAGPVEGMSNKP